MRGAVDGSTGIPATVTMAAAAATTRGRAPEAVNGAGGGAIAAPVIEEDDPENDCIMELRGVESQGGLGVIGAVQ